MRSNREGGEKKGREMLKACKCVEPHSKRASPSSLCLEDMRERPAALVTCKQTLPFKYLPSVPRFPSDDGVGIHARASSKSAKPLGIDMFVGGIRHRTRGSLLFVENRSGFPPANPQSRTSGWPPVVNLEASRVFLPQSRSFLVAGSVPPRQSALPKPH